jgi:Rab family protein
MGHRQEVYRGLASMYYRSGVIAIICFDVTNSASYASADYWIKELRANVEEGILILVCANKIDLEENTDHPGNSGLRMGNREGRALHGGKRKDMNRRREDVRLALGTFVKQKGTHNHPRQKSGVKFVEAQDVVRPRKNTCC